MAPSPRASPRRRAGASPAKKSPAGRSTPSSKTPKSLAPAKKAAAAFEYEFGGPIGAAAVMVGLPFVIVVLYFGCGAKFCVRSTSDASNLLTKLSDGLSSTTLWSWTATAAVFGWTALHFVLYLFLPGRVVDGVKLSDGSRLPYHINGHLAFWLTLTACWIGAHAINGTEPTLSSYAQVPEAFEWMYQHYVELIFASMALSLSISAYSHACAFRPGELLAEGGQSGNAIYDFFIGRPLNPRVGALDLKCACELRPGLIGWVLLNLGMAAAQAVKLRRITGSMYCVNFFQALYVWDALWNEQAILTTMDITTDGFGFMLAFGDLSWVPFTYTLQARLLVDHDPALSATSLALITALNVLGYVIFRGANSQKDAFRRDPMAKEVAHLEFMNTKRGTKLLTSGYWGMARKINYTGDWLMGAPAATPDCPHAAEVFCSP
jgi:delta14-sterol reductase